MDEEKLNHLGRVLIGTPIVPDVLLNPVWQNCFRDCENGSPMRDLVLRVRSLLVQLYV